MPFECFRCSIVNYIKTIIGFFSFHDIGMSRNEFILSQSIDGFLENNVEYFPERFTDLFSESEKRLFFITFDDFKRVFWFLSNGRKS